VVERTESRGDVDATELDISALERWIADRLPGQGTPLTAQRLGVATGIANALYTLERDAHRWVLRRPPAVKNDASASDTVREWRILNALEGTSVPHPTPRLLCEDTSIIGAPFMIMDLVDGFTPGFELPEPFASDPGLRRDLAMAYVDGCAALAGVDWRAAGLEGLGKPTGFLERQVPRWLAQLERYQTRALSDLDMVTRWLEANVPTMSDAGILHGDYSPFNVMVGYDAPVRLAAIVDWDTGTIGDPLLDLGHLLARWTEPGEEPVVTPQAGGSAGYPTRAEMAARYAERSERDLSALAFYEVLALFKLAVILEGTYAREHAAGVPDSENVMTELVPSLLSGARAFASGERR
jgi:aminoglycoside phosphotransferase (APT) family kinase protein